MIDEKSSSVPMFCARAELSWRVKWSAETQYGRKLALAHAAFWEVLCGGKVVQRGRLLPCADVGPAPVTLHVPVA